MGLKDGKIDVDLIIFDLDGTLIDSSTDIAWAANRTIALYGYGEIATPAIKEHIGCGVKPLLEKLMPGEPPERITEARESFLEIYGGHLLNGTFLYPGVEATLKHFLKMDKKMAVVTNKPEGLSRRILDELKISGCFGMVIGGDSLTNKKPHPEPVENALKGFGIAPSRAVMVGDSPVDCEAGRAAGTNTIGVSYGFRGRHELEEAGCAVIIDRFSDLKDRLG